MPFVLIRAHDGGPPNPVVQSAECARCVPRPEFDLGAAGTRSDTDLRPNYTLNWLPATGQAAVIKVRLRFIYKGEDFGNWSPWQQWTVTGV